MITALVLSLGILFALFSISPLLGSEDACSNLPTEPEMGDGLQV